MEVGSAMHSEAMDAFVAQVDAQTDILQVVQSYVPMKRRGNRYWGCCPFHHEKTPSFSVVPDKGFFYCFGCVFFSRFFCHSFGRRFIT